ncbi:arginase family protein [Listeria costaricensis]|uniref:arginase family protein n=1 Tax=Listeria costaricensis TaxID=2026604 RepID=UPI000C07D65B|nr:arginase family protein [Listeria costaricensis]
MKQVGLLGVPWSFSKERKGAGLGPYALRFGGILDMFQRLNVTVKDYHNMPFLTALEEETFFYHEDLEAITYKLKELQDILCMMALDVETPLILGGDQLIALSTIGAYRKSGKRHNVIWVNAHPDLAKTYQPKNHSGNTLASALGIGPTDFCQVMDNQPLHPEELVIMGTRRVMEEEWRTIQECQIRHYDMTKIDQMGMGLVMDEVLKWLSKTDRQVDLILDIDAIDPAFAPGTDYLSSGGLYYRELDYLMENLALSGRLASITITGLNPLLDEGNKTATLVIALLERYFQMKYNLRLQAE